jgi:hypothetical protein
MSKRTGQRGWAAALLLAGLWVAAGRTAEPDPLPPVEPASPRAAPKVLPPLGDVPTPPACANDAGPPADGGDGAASPFSRVPLVARYPSLGFQVIAPAGPGYYSLKDLLCNDFSKNTPKYPYPRFGLDVYTFFDADWRYLDDPNKEEHDWFDCLKRIHLGDNFLFTTGGELRVRYNDEVDSRLSGKDSGYTLTRARIYGDLCFRDIVRIYAEYLDADIFDENLIPLPTDRDHSDILNLFADVKIFEWDDHPAYLRLGRQELLYGSGRLISPLDWANTRRTFQGAKAFWRGDNVDIDAFVVQPVLPVTNKFDTVDDQVVFSGLWYTYRGEGRRVVDVYYLNLDQARDIFLGENKKLGAANTSTVGTRFYGDWCNFLYDFEPMLQFGTHSNQSIFAEALSAGLGYYFQDVPMTPQFWMYFDYASGDPRPGQGGTYRTFNQLFPFSHYYFGWIDVVARQNIEDINCEFSLCPTKWLTFWWQYHNFRLADARDALFSAAGVPLRRDPTGKAGTDVGNEFDFITNVHLTTHQDLLFDYSHLYAGDFIKRTGSPRSPDYLYVQYSFKW